MRIKPLAEIKGIPITLDLLQYSEIARMTYELIDKMKGAISNLFFFYFYIFEATHYLDASQMPNDLDLFRQTELYTCHNNRNAHTQACHFHSSS